MNERMWSLSGYPPDISGKEVSKGVDEHEANMLARYPSVFPRVLSVSALPTVNRMVVVMERLEPCGGLPTSIDNVYAQYTAYAHYVPELLRNNLWWRKPVQPSHPEWRNKLLNNVRQMTITLRLEGLKIIAERCVCESDNTATIHGDPTLSNTVWTSDKKPKLVDPTYRPYIPSDPHVDLGKIFQSLIGWETMLWNHHNGIYTLDRGRPMLDIAQSIARRTSLDYGLGMAWCVIHLLRGAIRALDDRMQTHIIHLLQVAYDEAL